MRLVRVPQRSLEQMRSVDSDAALTLPDVAGTTVTGSKQNVTRVASADFLFELQSAASMIMSREECEALQKELEQLHQLHHPVAA
ncbi:MAG: hypothetical protein NVSMB62_17700 [Acidobacteriaceae bacterium]